MTSRLARSAAANLRLLLLVAEGHAYLAGTVAAFAAVIAFLAWGLVTRQPLVALIGLSIGVPALALVGASVRALLFRLPEPEGLALVPGAAPALDALIADVRRALDAPRIHRVIIGPAFNASAVQLPRFAPFWPRNFLVVGYPLLLVLSPEQLRAVIAHEVTHLCHAHGRTAGLVHRTRLSWQRLAGVLGARGTVPIFVRWILAAYLPRLEAGSAAISRDREYLADRAAAAVAGVQAAADALVANELGAALLDEHFWPAIERLVEENEEPPRPFARMRAELARCLESPSEAQMLDRLLKSETAHWSDTHPSLRERLAALGVEPRVAPPATCVGEVLAATQLPVLAAFLDAAWQDSRRDCWRRRHAVIREAQLRLAELDAARGDCAETAFARGALLEQLGRADEALASYSEARAIGPRHARVAVAMGRLLLERGDASGASLVADAVHDEADVVPEGCALLSRHYRAAGRFADAARFEAMARRHATQRDLLAAGVTLRPPS